MGYRHTDARTHAHKHRLDVQHFKADPIDRAV